MRGRGGLIAGQVVDAGITPAYAGKSLPAEGRGRWSGDHPRVCGEEPVLRAQVWALQGSPPRVRGRASEALGNLPDVRITPARAGKRAPLTSGCGLLWDHPRACGEESCHRSSALARLGSPPRVRGRAGSPCSPGGPWGITPARAGKRSTMLTPEYGSRDHPRACGEESFSAVFRHGGKGSPPRVRGRETKQTAISIAGRITPARAGKSAHTGC